MAGFGANKDTEKMIKIARKAGWKVEMTRNNHIRFIPPASALNSDVIVAGLTMRDSGILQTRKRLRKAGLAGV